MENKNTREFKLSTLALKNKNTVFLVALSIILFGSMAYSLLPKELFPEVSFPTVMIQTVYPGNPPEDIENLITDHIEKEVQTVKGINKLTSISSQNVSMVIVEFNSDIQIKSAIQDLKDAVDKIRADLPSDLPSDPFVTDIDLSEFPVININLSGEFSIVELKDYAEVLKDEFEKIAEISKVEIKGINDKELKINVDQNKLEAFGISLTDIENAIAYENVSISGGEIKMGNVRRSIRTIGEFKNTEEIRNIIVKHDKGNIVHLRDVAEVVDGYEDPTSFARLNTDPVVSLQIIKKSGENLILAVDQIHERIEHAQKIGSLPATVSIDITNDQSKDVKSQLSNLENSMIIGVLFVVGVLFFFLGLRNALFVGVAIPMSMLLSFIVIGILGYTINMIILFGLILALGMLVDNAIVVIENIYRFLDNGYKLKDAARLAVGEIAMPIISSTATTLAAFFPLLFWDSLMGEFMKYLPITLIIVLTSSLLVALVIIPVFASTFVNKEALNKAPNKKKSLSVAAILGTMAILLYFVKEYAFANLLMLFTILIVLNVFFLFRASQWFQNVLLVWLEEIYTRALQFSLRKHNPTYIFFGTILLLILTLEFMSMRNLEMIFFPDNEPKYVNVIAELPIGTDVTATDSIVAIIENDVILALEPHKDIVESILTTIGEGAQRKNEMSVSKNQNKGMITIKFVDFEFRGGKTTSEIMAELSNTFNNRYSGIEIFVEKDANGPPTGAPVNIEVQGQEMDQLIAYTDTIQYIIDKAGIEGIEHLKIDIETGKPELIVSIDRESARRVGLSTAQIASTIRTALFGKEISSFKTADEEYPIQLRMAQQYSYNLASLMNQRITFRNNRGKIMQIPISSVASFRYSNSYGTIKHNDLERVVAITSNVVEGYNTNRINQQIQASLKSLKLKEGYSISYTGEQEEQAESMAFLVNALMIAIILILIILVSQFNSFIKPMIILASVLFSTIGVFGGIATFKMDIVVIMTGIGIISLAGVVVNNAIVLIDYIDFLKKGRKKDLKLDEDSNLPLNEIVTSIALAGKTRLRPVLLTAITTILGLLPMAVGLNIDFVRMFTHFDPNIYIGGDNAVFWGSMSWTVIFGLAFATFLTLIVVPVMYLMANKVKLRFGEK